MFFKGGILRSQLIVRSAKERGELVRQFCQTDILIMPSRTEGFGLTALESLSAGLPVLVSRNKLSDQTRTWRKNAESGCF